MKRQGQWFSVQGRGQIKPANRVGGSPCPLKLMLLLGKPDKPAVGRRLRGHHGHRRLVELKEAAAVRIVAGQNEVAAEFRQALFRPPERLALLDVPAGTGGGEQILGRRLATAPKREQGQRRLTGGKSGSSRPALRDESALIWELAKEL
jgi:hypothetical protein